MGQDAELFLLRRFPLGEKQGQTKLEFITEDYHYPGAYDLHGKVILEKGAPVLNDLHRTDEQTERACT